MVLNSLEKKPMKAKYEHDNNETFQLKYICVEFSDSLGKSISKNI